MKLGQIRLGGRITAAIFEENYARPVPNHTLLDLIDVSERESKPLTEIAAAHATKGREEGLPILPLLPREVWACGCTYESSATFRDAEHGTREGFYAHVLKAPRPEIFFKGTARVCVGPRKPIGIRSDSSFTAPEPELAVVMGAGGKVLGYTLANDVSAWDIERENPLYLPQSKVYTACCALGPWIVTPDELINPYGLLMKCSIRRGEELVFEGQTTTANLSRRIEALIEYLLRANPVPAGSVLLTGTGIIVPAPAALQPGDVVSITATGMGELCNEAQIV